MEYGYIAVELQKKDILPIKKAIKNMCKPNDFYYSNVIDYIKGDVSSKMHLTLFYGLIDKDIDKGKLSEHIKRIRLLNLKLGKLILMNGYQNQYKLLCLEVLDNDNNLKRIHNSFKAFSFDPNVQHDSFKPHLTLCYLKRDFALNNRIDFPKEIKIGKIVYDI